jgi:hypothetical protein
MEAEAGKKTPDDFCSQVRIVVAVRSRNAVEWRLARDKSELVNHYAKRHLNAKYAGNATADMYWYSSVFKYILISAALGSQSTGRHSDASARKPCSPLASGRRLNASAADSNLA